MDHRDLHVLTYSFPTRRSSDLGSEPRTSCSIAEVASRTHAAAGAVTHVKYLDHGRALAILQIVLLHAGHAFLLRGFESPLPESNPVFAAVDVLLRNATIYFSMISGIIYARIFCSRPYAPL